MTTLRLGGRVCRNLIVFTISFQLGIGTALAQIVQSPHAISTSFNQQALSAPLRWSIHVLAGTPRAFWDVTGTTFVERVMFLAPSVSQANTHGLLAATLLVLAGATVGGEPEDSNPETVIHADEIYPPRRGGVVPADPVDVAMRLMQALPENADGELEVSFAQAGAWLRGPKYEALRNNPALVQRIQIVLDDCLMAGPRIAILTQELFSARVKGVELRKTGLTRVILVRHISFEVARKRGKRGAGVVDITPILIRALQTVFSDPLRGHVIFSLRNVHDMVGKSPSWHTLVNNAPDWIPQWNAMLAAVFDHAPENPAWLKLRDRVVQLRRDNPELLSLTIQHRPRRETKAPLPALPFDGPKLRAHVGAITVDLLTANELDAKDAIWRPRVARVMRNYYYEGLTPQRLMETHNITARSSIDRILHEGVEQLHAWIGTDVITREDLVAILTVSYPLSRAYVLGSAPGRQAMHPDEVRLLIQNPPLTVLDGSNSYDWTHSEYRRVLKAAIHHFGSWRAAVADAGIDRYRRKPLWVHRYTDWDVVRRIAPTYYDLANGTTQRRQAIRMRQEVRALAEEIAKGNLAAHQVFVEVHRYAIDEAIHHLTSLRRGMMDYEDLQGACFTALVRSVELYDPNHGALFTTYLQSAMRNTIIRWMVSRHRILEESDTPYVEEQVEAPVAITLGWEEREILLDLLDATGIGERDQAIFFRVLERAETGESFQQIGDSFGLKRTAVHQVVNRVRLRVQQHLANRELRLPLFSEMTQGLARWGLSTERFEEYVFRQGVFTTIAGVSLLASSAIGNPYVHVFGAVVSALVLQATFFAVLHRNLTPAGFWFRFSRGAYYQLLWLAGLSESAIQDHQANNAVIDQQRHIWDAFQPFESDHDTSSKSLAAA